MTFLEAPNKITPYELRKFEGCENLTDKEVEEIINTLYELSLISYEILFK